MSVDLIKMLQEDIDCSSDIIEENISIKLLKIQYLKKSNKLKIILKSINNLSNNIENRIKEIISKKLGCFKNIDLIYYKDYLM